MDELEETRQPSCPECGTVLRDVAGGYVCRSCNMAYLPQVDSPR